MTANAQTPPSLVKPLNAAPLASLVVVRSRDFCPVGTAPRYRVVAMASEGVQGEPPHCLRLPGGAHSGADADGVPGTLREAPPPLSGSVLAAEPIQRFQ